AAPPRRGGGLFDVKPTDVVIADTEDGRHALRRAVGALDLTALGIGAIIGTGIFVIIGEAIGKSGPAIILSFVLAGVTCLFSALSYAELAAMIPVSGSAYTYSYATLGELVAWIIGWDLILEYGFSVAVVAVGWGGYLNTLLGDVFGATLPNAIANPPGEGGVVNVPAVFLVLLITGVLIIGVRESARFNTGMVIIKLAVLAFFVVLGFTAIKSQNYSPFAPKGFSGMADAAALIFFAYIGFDAVSTSSEEARKPSRDLPLALVGSLVIATVVYILVAVVAVGLLPANQLAANAKAPLSAALQIGGGFSFGADVIAVGALVAITSVVLTILYGQTRITFAMCRDGLLPRGLARLSKRRTPWLITLIFGLLAAGFAAFIPLSALAELVNIGTLFAFILVNVGVIWLRRTQPEVERPFRVPLVPLFPIIGTLLCIYLMTKLSGATWWRFGIWLVVGLVIYAAYGYRHSRLRRGEPINPGTEMGARPASRPG
ncbi:MAG TPA: amino acid permease, partial [Solirubrobacteraceae bacterium]|nr:amino acid permease [Solirubrobacteraceae bacterium]